jgi:hypothetical protein
LPLLALARHGHLPGLNTKALHAQSYGTIRQSTGSQHANKAWPSTSRLLRDKEEGQAWLCLPTTPIPQTQAWPSLAQRLSMRRATARSDRAPALYTHLLFPTLSLSLGTQLPLNTHMGIHPNVHTLLSLPNWTGSCSSEMVAIPAQARNAF